MKNVVVKLGVFLVTTALARAAATEGERSTGHVMDPKENDIHNADFSEMSEEEVMDFDYWNLTSYQDIGARNGFCDLEGYNPCNSDPKMIHKHPSKCEYFIQCSGIFPWCMKCPVNQHWSESINDCIPKENSDCTQCECGETNKRRIIGGTEVLPSSKYPWTVGLRMPGKLGNDFICGGSIINNLYILTAAHCVVDKPSCNKLKSFAKQLEVITITNNYGIKDIVPHCDYNCDSVDFDVALLEIDSEIVFDDIIRPICLPKDDNEAYIGKTGIATGWGSVTKPLPYIYEMDLKEVELTIRANDDCGLWKSEISYCNNKGTTPILSSAKLCAGGDPNKSTCAGDSGGPFFVLENNKYVQVGIVSFGPDICASADYPIVFTRVSKLMGWIKATTQNAKKCN